MQRISRLNVEESSQYDGREDAMASLRAVVKRKNAYWQRLVVLKAGAFSIALPLAYLGLIFSLDGIIHLSILGRFLASLVLFVIVTWVSRRFIGQWKRSRFSDDQVALAIERRTPARLENRLINSIQISRSAPARDQPAVQAVLEENYTRLRDIHLKPPTETRSAVMQAALAVALVMAGFLFGMFQPQRFSTAATRIFLPFSRVTPVYRTVLAVEPGDIKVKAGDDVTMRVSIRGKIPAVIAVLQKVDGRSTSLEVPVSPGSNQVDYQFKSLRQSLTYAVRGGDYVTPFYTISVLAPTELKTLTALYRYPAYTGLPERRQESARGDLEALYGTCADLRFTLTHPAAQVSLLIETAAVTGSAAAAVPQPMKKIAPTEFSGELVLKDLSGYKLEIQQENDPEKAPRAANAESYESQRYEICVTADLPPELQLTGVDQQSEVMIDAVLPLVLAAKDDYGLKEAGIFYRRAPRQHPDSEEDPVDANALWQAIKTWTVPEQARAFEKSFALSVAALNAVEGEELELAARGKDNDPLKGDAWHTARRYVLTIGGPGVALQALYERILRTEAELKALVKDLEGFLKGSAAWLDKLDPGSGRRWDDEKNLKDLAAAMAALAKSQSQIRQTTAAIAREMAAPSGALRISVGLLADTEMVRCIQIIEKVPAADTLSAKKSALAEARLAQERTRRSLDEIIGQYEQFRKDWELDNMIPFTRMLAERQLRMKNESLTYAELSVAELLERLPNACGQRQLKIAELAGLAQKAFAGMGGRTEVVGPVLAAAFGAAAAAFDESALKSEMRQAADKLRAGKWREAYQNQEKAAALLAEIHFRLYKAQIDLAQQALEELKELAAASTSAQEEIAGLSAGTDEFLFDLDTKDFNPTDILHMQELAARLKKKFAASGTLADDLKMEDWIMEWSKIRQEPHQGIEGVTLAQKPLPDKSYPAFANLEGERLKSRVQEEFQDIVGDLLDEIEELKDQYESYNLISSFQLVDAGDISKPDGMFSSSQARGFTGNQKPVTKNMGGASRAGRQGGRTYGLAVGDKSINRRGRDDVQEGDESAPDQEGQMKEILSDDPQQETSTGVGGKEVGAERTSFSTRNAGEWKDEMADRLKPPAATARIVERQGKPLNPHVAELLRDLASGQEQVLERIKRIKKELDNLYLPSDHLDEIMAQLAAGLDRLKETPEADVFRQQLENLDKLKGMVVVFNRPSSEFQPSVVHAQPLRGRILDEPAWQTIPGYEEAVKRYYLLLSGQ